jgi:hypothetical protein
MLEIKSDGTSFGTQVLQDGKPIGMVERCEIIIDAKDGIPRTKLTILKPKVDVNVPDKNVEITERNIGVK